ncbi:hypothetical protein Hanom_Chr17g01587241 [Helianthus anomalus]
MMIMIGCSGFGFVLVLVRVTQGAGEATGAVESTRLNRVNSAQVRVSSLVQTTTG